ILPPRVFLLGVKGPGNHAAASAAATAAKAQLNKNTSQPAPRSLDEGGTETLEKMIVESGSVTMDLDVNRLDGITEASGKVDQVRFLVAANSFFPILVFNHVLRAPESGSMTLVPARVNAPGYSLPVALGASLKQLAVEKLSSGQAFDLAVRDSNTGFTLNVEGHQYNY